MIANLLKLLKRDARATPLVEKPVTAESPLPVHSLKDNHHLTGEQYAHCLKLVDRVEQLYNEAPAYVERRGLDPALYFPGNEWAGIVPVSGARFHRGYTHIDYLRLMAPFAGYFLFFLDRLDNRLYAESWNDQILVEANESGVSEEMVDLLASRVDPRQRLAACYDILGKVSPCADEYRRHVRNVPKRYLVRTPRTFGEIGIEVDGLLVNPDIILCQSRINGMLCSGVLDKLDADIRRRGKARVLEIGPGYGPLGQALRTIYGHRLEYIAVDLPSILYNSSIYLSVLANGEGCHLLLPGEKVPETFRFLFVANYLLDELADSLGPIDLGLNTMSFPEMSPAQVGGYALFLKRTLRADGVVFDENHANKPHHTDSKAILAEVFGHRKKVSSELVATKYWCQDVWSTNYVPEVFDCSDAMLLR